MQYLGFTGVSFAMQDLRGLPPVRKLTLDCNPIAGLHCAASKLQINFSMKPSPEVMFLRIETISEFRIYSVKKESLNLAHSEFILASRAHVNWILAQQEKHYVNRIPEEEFVDIMICSVDVYKKVQIDVI